MDPMTKTLTPENLKNGYALYSMARSGKPKNEGDTYEQMWVRVVYCKQMQKLVQFYKHTFVSKGKVIQNKNQ